MPRPRKGSSPRQEQPKLGITRYFLKSVDADRKISRVGAFPKGVWVEVDLRVFNGLYGSPGWDGYMRED